MPQFWVQHQAVLRGSRAHHLAEDLVSLPGLAGDPDCARKARAESPVCAWLSYARARLAAQFPPGPPMAHRARRPTWETSREAACTPARNSGPTYVGIIPWRSGLQGARHPAPMVARHRSLPEVRRPSASYVSARFPRQRESAPYTIHPVFILPYHYLRVTRSTCAEMCMHFRFLERSSSAVIQCLAPGARKRYT
jgi:hypothetical protein